MRCQYDTVKEMRRYYEQSKKWSTPNRTQGSLIQFHCPCDKLAYEATPDYLPSLPHLRASRAGNMKRVKICTKTVSVYKKKGGK
jgi:hypothetical protein